MSDLTLAEIEEFWSGWWTEDDEYNSTVRRICDLAKLGLTQQARIAELEKDLAHALGDHPLYTKEHTK